MGGAEGPSPIMEARLMRYVQLCLLVFVLSLGLLWPTGPAAAEKWLGHHDALFGVEVELPPDWTLTAPSSASPGRVLTLRSAEGSEIAFGPRLTKRSTSDDLGVWRQRLEAALAPYGAPYGSYSSKPLRVDGLVALQVLEQTPLGLSRTTEIARGEMVWFVWDAGQVSQTAVYDRVVASIRFTEHTPQTLTELYGEAFAAFELSASGGRRQAAVRGPSIGSLRAPISGLWTAKCSPTHSSSQTNKALDVFLPVGLQVYAAAAGEVLHAGWWGNYGNLVKVNHEPLESFYGHLDQIWVSSGWTVWKGRVVGLSGDTGLGSAHLHFEVRDRYANTGVSLGPVDGLSVNGNYPGQNGSQLISCGYFYYDTPWH